MRDELRIFLVLKSGGNYGVRDVELIARKLHFHADNLRIFCLSDTEADVQGVTFLKMIYDWPRWWGRMALYSPRFFNVRPFLFIDLDTIVLGDINKLVEEIENKEQYVTLSDFYQKGQLASGIVWYPKHNKKINSVWIAWVKSGFAANERKRMDYFLRTVTSPDKFWQQITDKIEDFKPLRQPLLQRPKPETILVCLHGKPSIWQADVEWVKKYRNE